MYHVLENNKPATLPESKCVYWHNNSFIKFEDALKYARVWLGYCYGGSDDGESGVDLVVNRPYCFYHTDFDEMWIEIREVV